MNAVRALAQKFRQQSLLAMLIEAVAALLLFNIFVSPVIGWLRLFWLVPLAAAAGLFAARRKWPRVRLRHYFLSRRAVLPVACAAGGWGLQYVLLGLGVGPVSTTVASMLIGGLVAAVALGVVMMILEGKLMKSIFDLVPADKRPELREFVQAGNPTATGTGGQFADFTELDPATVASTIEERVIGQNLIVENVVTTAFRRARLRRPRRPVATFLFVGATGSGKTELAKALATTLFQGRMIRIDCNELSRPEGVSRLIGAPPGYIGSADGGQLCRDIARTGTGVLLFDEIEKADPGVLKVIMGLLDEARLTEQSTGQTYSATGFLIVLTSNAAADEIAQVVAAQSDPTARAGKVKDALRAAGFLPEVLARLDAVFPFGELDRAAVVEIVGKFLVGFASDTGVELAEVDPALLVDLVTKQEKLAGYGIREVVRLVENAVVDGMLAARDAGAKAVAVRVRGGAVQVLPVDGQAVAGGVA